MSINVEDLTKNPQKSKILSNPANVSFSADYHFSIEFSGIIWYIQNVWESNRIKDIKIMGKKILYQHFKIYFGGEKWFLFCFSITFWVFFLTLLLLFFFKYRNKHLSIFGLADISFAEFIPLINDIIKYSPFSCH